MFLPPPNSKIEHVKGVEEYPTIVKAFRIEPCKKYKDTIKNGWVIPPEIRGVQM
jgi:hypothetical protein